MFIHGEVAGTELVRSSLPAWLPLPTQLKREDDGEHQDVAGRWGVGWKMAASGPGSQQHPDYCGLLRFFFMDRSPFPQRGLVQPGFSGNSQDPGQNGVFVCFLG